MSREVIGWGRRDGDTAAPSDPDAPPLTVPPTSSRPIPPAGLRDGPSTGWPHERQFPRDEEGLEEELDDVLDGGAGPRRPGWLDRLDRPRRRRLLAATLLASTAFGWLGPDLGPSDILDRPTPVVVALVTENRYEPASRGSASTTLQVAISNLSTTPVQLTGFDTAYVAAEVTLVHDAGRVIAPGASLRTDVSVSVLCTVPTPLVLPTLKLRDVDGVEFHLPVAGSVQALVESCAGGDTTPVLGLVSSAVEGDRLRLSLSTLGGRTLRLLAMSVDDVALAGRPLPATMDSPTRVMWLNPPTTCPDVWRTRGLPDTVHATIATSLDRRYGGEGTADVSLRVGVLLAHWLSATACKGVA